ncbi:MAG: hypothetical protein Q4B60_00790 [Erysipelotrichaceae bacterium]|nr:hypothetical protein [Erysipelotrichaceae bacterium]
MKKIVGILLALCVLFGCSANKTEKIEERDLKIVAPNGAPALSLLSIMDKENLSLDIVDGAEVLQAEFVNGEADIIIAPVNLGLKLSEKTGNYKLASVLTWGNLHLVSTNSDGSSKIAAFGEAAVPGKVINFLKEELNIEEIEWFAEVSETSAALINGTVDTAILAEPFLTMTKGKYEGTIYEIMDVQKVYENKTGYSSYPQAAMFVNVNLLNDEYLNVLKEEIKVSIENYNSDSDKLSARIDDVDLNILGFKNADLIKKAYSKMALNYKDAKDVKEEITSFLNLFGMELNEELISD